MFLGPELERMMAGQVIERDVWAQAADRWRGELEGAAHGAGISLIFVSTDEVGDGPRLHSHPYAETFIIRAGRGLYTIGEAVIEAQAGQILVVPAGVPHKFVNLGPGRLEATDVHESGRFITDWLE
jgi:mannose-6-phosphate isomerase-like protein (cupin superfamily)